MPLLLSELNAMIQATVENQFRGQSFDVIAEIGQITIKKEKQQAHIGLVEKAETPGKFKARLEAKMWRNLSLIDQFEKATGQILKAGMQVLFKLSVQFHPEYGISAQVLNIDPNYTIGALAQEKEKTIQKLLIKHPEKLKLIDGELHSFNQQLSLPFIIQRIALITAKGAEGGIDFLDELVKNRQGYCFQIEPFFAVMQGESAAESIKQAILQAFLSDKKFDLIVIVRGGGAALDLHAYDQFTLVETIVKCPIPIYTGIGHTRNISLTDQVAKGAFKSPTKVAEEIIHYQERAELLFLAHWQKIQQQVPKLLNGEKQNISRVQLDVIATTNGTLEAAKSNLQEIQVDIQKSALSMIQVSKSGIAEHWKNIGKEIPKSIQLKRKGLEDQFLRLNKNCHSNIRLAEKNLSHLQQFVEAHSPQKWLNRGFGILEQNGKTIGQLDQIEKNTPLEILMKGGKIITQIKDIQHD